MAVVRNDVGVVFSGAVLAGAVGVGLWYVTHLGRRTRTILLDPAAARFERNRARRRGVLVAGLVALAAAFFVGINFLPVRRGERASVILFVTYWSLVLALAAGLALLALVDLWLYRRFLWRRAQEALIERHRQAGRSAGPSRPKMPGHRETDN